MVALQQANRVSSALHLSQLDAQAGGPCVSALGASAESVGAQLFSAETETLRVRGARRLSTAKHKSLMQDTTITGQTVAVHCGFSGLH